MKIAFFSSKNYDRTFFVGANRSAGHDITFFEPRLSLETAPLAAGYPAVCIFVNDRVDAATAALLAANGTRVIALRCAGFNNVDLQATAAHGLTVVRVPAYSPHAVAEHAVALLLALNRKIHRAHARVREGNFALEGLLGFDLHGKSAGIIGTGQIGAVVARILHGFGCTVLASDPMRNPDCEKLGVVYTTLPDLFAAADIITLHCPLIPETFHLINDAAIAQFKPGVMLINTSRGALVDTRAVIRGLKSGKIGYLGLDVYEEEADLFFEDLSDKVLQDDVFARLLTFPNVLITGHQAYFTANALERIAAITLENIAEVERGGQCRNALLPQRRRGGAAAVK